jgi:SAM-dependent methyltransferase
MEDGVDPEYPHAVVRVCLSIACLAVERFRAGANAVPGTASTAPASIHRVGGLALARTRAVATTESTVRRLNWACGPTPAPGWINADRLRAPGIALSGDIRDGLPLDDDAVDYAVAIHGLQDLSYPEVVPALQELRRVLRSGGVLRLGLPDLDRALAAYARGDAGYFYIADAEVTTLSGKLIVQLTWYGSVRTPFTWEFARELLLRAGFRRVTRCDYRLTASPHADIVELDNRERESLFVEAVK